MNKQQLRNVLPGGIHHKVASDWAASDDAVAQKLDGNMWFDIPDPFWRADAVYRIKTKTLRYRVAICIHPGSGEKYLQWIETKAGEEHLKASSNFLEWAGDWQEVEVPHG